MNKNLKFIFLTGWLAPVAIALTYFARWIREIVVPTLKGGNFDQLYDLHGGIRYLDTTFLASAVAFCWFAIVLFRWAQRQTSPSTIVIPNVVQP